MEVCKMGIKNRLMLLSLLKAVQVSVASKGKILKRLMQRVLQITNLRCELYLTLIIRLTILSRFIMIRNSFGPLATHIFGTK